MENLVNLFSFCCLSFLSHEPQVYLKKASLFGSLSSVNFVNTSFGLPEINLLVVTGVVIHLIVPTLLEILATHLLEEPITVDLIMIGLCLVVFTGYLAGLFLLLSSNRDISLKSFG